MELSLEERNPLSIVFLIFCPSCSSWWV